MIKMLTLAVLLPWAQQTSPAPSGPMSGGPLMLLFWVFFIGGMYFLLIAPQRKKQKEQEKMLSALASGRRGAH